MLCGFQEETEDSQLVFRKMLSAMATPGKIEQLNMEINCPGILHPAAGAILLSLLDFETPFWSDLKNSSQEVQWLRFHTGAPFMHMKRQALFALATDYDQLEDPNLFNPGTLSSPDISTTLLVQTRGLDKTGRLRLTGPGIQNESYLKLDGIKETFLKRRSEMTREFPLGIDLFFICENRFVALPRTTCLEVF